MEGTFLVDSPLNKAKSQTESAVVHKFGAIKGVTTTLTPVTSSGTYQTPTIAQTLELLSDNANDTVLGTGARTVKVEGLGADHLKLSVIVDTNGLTPVPILTDFLRVDRVLIVDSGTYASAAASSQAGSITVRGEDGGVIWALAEIDAGFGLGQSEIGVTSISKGKTAFVNFKNYDVESTKRASLYFFVREGLDVVVAPFTPMRTKQVHRNQANSHLTKPTTPFGPYVGPCDIGFMGKADSGTADIQVDFEVELINT